MARDGRRKSLGLMAICCGVGCHSVTEAPDGSAAHFLDGGAITTNSSATASSAPAASEVEDSSSPCASHRPDPSVLRPIKSLYGGGEVLSAPAVTADRFRIDPDRALAGAKVVANMMGKDVELSGLSFGNIVVDADGMFPMIISDTPRLHQRLTFYFVAKVTPSRPGGHEKQGIHVILDDGEFFGTKAPVREEVSWEPPCCPIRRVFRAVIASGVPHEAILSFGYEGSTRDRTPHWWAKVDNHPEFTRKVDGRTCDVIETKHPVE